MKTVYVETALYAYPHLDKISKLLDNLILSKALSTRNNISSCEDQCLKLIYLKMEKQELSSLKKFLDGFIDTLTDAEREVLKLAYFQDRDAKISDDWSTAQWKRYYRTQEKLLKRLSYRFDFFGIEEAALQQLCESKSMKWCLDIARRLEKKRSKEN